MSATVTLLFTDVVGSTQLLHDLGDDRFNEMRRVHFRQLRDAIVEFGGQEVKNLGDGLMAVFPSVLDACRCAVEMQRSVAGGELAIRIGLHVGEPITYGDDYFGASVGVARQLCERGVGGQILVSDLVMALVGGREGLSLSKVESFEIAGQDTKLGAHELTWRRAGAPPWKVPLPPGLATDVPAFVGRQEELGQLQAAWKRAQEGQIEVAAVSGEPGMGKTRLVAETARAAWSEGGIVVHGRCDEEGMVAFLPVLDILRQLARAMPAELLADLASRSVELATIVPEMNQYGGTREVASLATSSAEAPEEDEDLRPSAPAAPRTTSDRYVFFEAVAAVLRTAAEQAPLILVIDDVHWADEPSLLLLRHVLRSLRHHRVLVMLTWRHRVISPLPDLVRGLPGFLNPGRTVVLSLDGLAEPEIGSLLHALMDEPPPRAFLANVHRQTDGNPYFVEEFVRDLIETGILSQESGHWVTQGAGAPRLPEGISEVIGRRLSHLGSDTQQVLTVASVIGRTFGLDALRELTEFSEDQLLDAVEEAVSAGLISEEAGPVGQFRFCHALIRETLYAELSVTRRVLLHRRIANALEARYASNSEARLTELAYHFHEAAPLGDATKAVRYCQRAADQAMAGYAYEEAARLYQMALNTARGSEFSDDAATAEVLLALGTARARSGDLSGARSACLEAAVAARASGKADQLALAALGLGPWVEFGSVDKERRHLIEEALEAVGPGDSALRALLLATLSHILLYSGNPEEVCRLAGEAEAVARRLADADVLSNALAARHDSLWGPHVLPQRLRLTDERLDLVRGSGDREQQAMVRCHRLIDLLESGDAQAAWQELDAHRDLAIAMRQPLHRGFSAMFGATRALFEGRFAEAERMAHEAADLRETDPNVLHQFGAQLFFIRREQDGLQELESFLTTGTSEPGAWPSAASALTAALAVFLCETGRHEEAAAEFERLAAKDFAEIALDAAWLPIHAMLAEVCAELVDVRRAAQLYDVLAPYRDRMLVVGLATASTGSLARQVGMLAMTFGRLDLAVEHFTTAVERNRAAGARPWTAHSQHDLATALFRQRGPGDRELARRHLDEATAAAHEMGMKALLRRIEAARVAAR